MSKPSSPLTLSDEDYNLIFEPEFMTFNKIRTVMCRNSPCTRGNRCTFAHSATELRKSLCMYHFNNGCNKSSSTCIHSHNDADLDKSIVDYKKWKNPSPKVAPKKPTDEELIKEFGEFKISLEESDSEDDEEYEDESEKEMAKLVKASAKRPYTVVSIADGSSAFTPTQEYLQTSGIVPLVPLEDWEKADRKDDTESPSKEQKTSTDSSPSSGSVNPFEGNPNSEVYTLIFNQQVMIMNLMNQIQELKTKVDGLMNKK